MRSWVWLSKDLLLAIHEEQLSEHGGGVGVRKEGLLASALARPLDLAAYKKPDVSSLAAAYAFGVARNHPFVDGNKRVAAAALELFIDLNGYALTADDTALATTIMALAEGSLSEAAVAGWIRKNTRKGD